VPIILLGVLYSVWDARIFSIATLSLRRSVLASSRNALYALLIPAVAGLSIGAPLVLRVWAPPSYRPDGLLVVVALVAVTSFVVAGMLASSKVLLMEGRTAVIAAFTVVAGAANVALNIALVPSMGIDGSALATLLGYGLLYAFLTLAARRKERLPRPSTKLVAKLVAACAVAFAATRLPTTLPFLVLRLTVAGFCLVTVVAMLFAIAAPGRSRILAWIAAGQDLGHARGGI
jgi:O-antigen/teichoic acid export membrane protein